MPDDEGPSGRCAYTGQHNARQGGMKGSGSYDDVLRYGFIRTDRPLRVLVVDDVHDVAMMLALIVKRIGHKVLMAHDADDALQQAEVFQPQVIFLDIGLPGKDGYELCGSMRGRPWGKGALIIAVTGRNEPADRERSMRTGFDMHVVKPMDFHTLREILHRVENP